MLISSLKFAQYLKRNLSVGYYNKQSAAVPLQMIIIELREQKVWKQKCKNVALTLTWYFWDGVILRLTN